MTSNKTGTANKYGKRVSSLTLARLGQYLHFLDSIDDVGAFNISSKTIGEALDIKPTQVRKDLSFFGEFGQKSKGYDIFDLKKVLKEILGLNQTYKAAIVGAGNLGSALLNFKSLTQYGFKIVAVFDNDKNKIGMVHYGHKIYDISSFKEIVTDNRIEIGIITTPAEAAQGVAELMCESAIGGIINFTTKKIKVPPFIRLQEVDLTLEFFAISHHLNLK
ncbi:MAG TPA: redox-sensing transcriptional repressor Rex [Candidatus Wallbacteria bacterium]|nr:redox-sensing transcriptional repressor Rex [Candidatus Wallbacteria bacterium]